MDRDTLFFLLDHLELFILIPFAIFYIGYCLHVAWYMAWDKRWEKKHKLRDTVKEQHLTLIEKLIKKLDGHEFEDFMGYIFRKNDIECKNTKKTGDGGKDLILKKDGEKIYVELKRYADENKVDDTIIKKLFASCVHDDIKKGMIITTSSYTTPALECIDKLSTKGVEIEHLYMVDIMEMVARLDTRDVLVWLGYDIKEAYDNDIVVDKLEYV